MNKQIRSLLQKELKTRTVAKKEYWLLLIPCYNVNLPIFLFYCTQFELNRFANNLSFSFLCIEITLQTTNIFPPKGILKMIFLFRRWDMWSFPGEYIERRKTYLVSTFLCGDVFVFREAVTPWNTKTFNSKLGGGFKDFLFSPLLGEMIQFDS